MYPRPRFPLVPLPGVCDRGYRSGMEDLLRTTSQRAARYLAGLKDRGVAPTPQALANLGRLDETLPECPTDPSAVIALLDAIGSPRRVIAAVQADGTCWAGGTVWQGRTAMRISVSSWATTEQDVERSLEAMLRVVTQVHALY